MSDVPPPKTLLAALFVGGIPLLMGAAAFYFTSGVTLRCERNASGHAACTEGRRFLKLIVDAYAKDPKAEGLTLGDQAGCLVFFFHIFSTIFIFAGVTTFTSYVKSLFGRSGG